MDFDFTQEQAMLRDSARTMMDKRTHCRNARSATIGIGTSQMQRNTIAGLMGLKIL